MSWNPGGAFLKLGRDTATTRDAAVSGVGGGRGGANSDLSLSLLPSDFLLVHPTGQIPLGDSQQDCQRGQKAVVRKHCSEKGRKTWNG